jgi:hypothetical protein
MSGRRLAAILSASGLGLGLNFGAPSETLLPPDLVGWIAETGAAAPGAATGRPTELGPPVLPGPVILTLDQRLAAAEGLFRRAWLARATWENGSAAHLLAIEEEVPGAAEAIARLVAEALAFAGGGAEINVAAVPTDSPLVPHLERVALRFDPPERASPSPPDSDRPPRLR